MSCLFLFCLAVWILWFLKRLSGSKNQKERHTERLLLFCQFLTEFILINWRFCLFICQFLSDRIYFDQLAFLSVYLSVSVWQNLFWSTGVFVCLFVSFCLTEFILISWRFCLFICQFLSDRIYFGHQLLFKRNKSPTSYPPSLTNFPMTPSPPHPSSPHPLPHPPSNKPFISYHLSSPIKSTLHWQLWRIMALFSFSRQT